MGMTSIVGKAVKASREKIKAYHGSPHSFDSFSTDNIGTGEGAQAYGRGLYFAEREGTAQSYKGSTNYADKKRQFQRELPDDADFDEVMEMADEGAFSPEMTELLYALDEDGWLGFDYPAQSITAALSKDIANWDPSPRLLKAVDSGHMYEVNIDASPDELLDYDLPLSEQSDYVKSRLPKELLEREDARGITAVKDFPLENSEMMSTSEYRIKSAEALQDLGIKGIKYADAQTRFSPGKKTSNYVIFDQNIIDIAKKYGVSMPVASAIAAGTLTPEEAQAGPLTAGMRRVIDARFSTPVGGGNPRAGVMDSVETMQTGIDPRAMDTGSASNLYDFEGSPYILTQSDRSAAGGVLQSVHGKNIDEVDLRGGRDFMFDPKSDGMVWASDPNVVNSLSKRAAQLKSQYGKDPILLPYTMAPTGIDFATMPLDVMINYARQGMSKANIKKLDSQIKAVIPNWKGVADPSANDVFREVKGPSRKKVADIIDKNFRDVNGGLSISEARAATSDSSQYVVPEGNIRNVGRIDTSRPVIADSGHPTYIGGLPGEGVGTLTEEINARPFMEVNGRELANDMSDIRSLSMNHQFGQGLLDENLLRKIYNSIDGKKAVAAASIVGAGGVSAEEAAFQGVLAEADERQGKSRQWRMKNPPSKALREYTASQMVPGLGTMAQGALEASAETLDYINPINIARLLLDPADEGLKRFISPPVTSSYSEAVRPVTDFGLLDERDPKNKDRRKALMGVGSLFSPL